MRRQFFVHYANFSNTYDLMYADTQEDLCLLPVGAERITRKEAERLCAEENHRHKYDSSFSGFADNTIYPVGMTSEERMNIMNDRRYFKKGYLWERRVR